VKKKKQGTEKQVAHKEPLTSEDLSRVGDCFKDCEDDPRKLTEYCWFVMTIHFCLRGQELQGTLKKEDLVFEQVAGTTAEGQETVRLGTDAKKE